MRARFGFAGLALVALLSAGRSAAEPTGSYAYLIPFGGYTQFDGTLRFPHNKPLVDDLYLGGRLGYRLLPWLSLEAASGFTTTTEDTAGGADVDFLHGSGNLAFTPLAGWYGGPFLSVGYGVSQLKPSAGAANLKQGNLELAGGLNLWFTDMIGARLEARDLMWLNKEEPTKIGDLMAALEASVAAAREGRRAGAEKKPAASAAGGGRGRGAGVDDQQ